MATALITHPGCTRHEMGDYHPEQPARLEAIERLLRDSGLLDRLQQYRAPLASREQLARCHGSDHIERIHRAVPAEDLAWLDGDTAMNPHSLEAALRAAGAAVDAVDRVMSGEVDNAFCAVRPPGHHAEGDRAMGFCLFNNIAVAAYHALEQLGLRRVAIVDFDVHHGNGTEDIVAGDERILLCSTFQYPFYPFSGVGDNAGNIVNVPLAAGTGGREYRSQFNAHCLPALRNFEPELVLVSAGFDAHRDDPLGGMNLVEEDYAWVTRQIVEVAGESAAGRIVSSLEGGYDLDALARSVATHLQVLADN